MPRDDDPISIFDKFFGPFTPAEVKQSERGSDLEELRLEAAHLQEQAVENKKEIVRLKELVWKQAQSLRSQDDEIKRLERTIHRLTQKDLPNENP